MRWYKTLKISAITMALLIPLTGSGQEASEDNQLERPVDTSFVEIALSENGVNAIDSAGLDWFYDFEEGVFVQGVREDDAGNGGFTGSSEDQIPIEERCTDEIEVDPFTKSVVVAANEYVDGDIIAKGRVTIRGWVKGDVMSFGSRVLVTETGQIDGNVKAPKVLIRNGGVVLGEVKEASIPVPEIDALTRTFSAGGVIAVVSITVFLLMLVGLWHLLFPKYLTNMIKCTAKHSARCFFLGFAGLFLFPLALVVLTVTIIGIAALPVAAIALALSVCTGIILSGRIMARALLRRMTEDTGTNVYPSVIGVLITMLLWVIAASLLGSSDSTSEGFGVVFLVTSILLTSFQGFTGIGAAMLTWFGYRDYTVERQKRKRVRVSLSATAPAPPPLPKSPPLPKAPPIPKAPPSAGESTETNDPH